MSGVNTANIPLDLLNEAVRFVQEHIPFLDTDFRIKVRDKLASLLDGVVKKHTSSTTNTALRETLRTVEVLAKHAHEVLPTKVCHCPALDNGDHAPQPLCHVCTIKRIRAVALAVLADADKVVADGKASISG